MKVKYPICPYCGNVMVDRNNGTTVEFAGSFRCTKCGATSPCVVGTRMEAIVAATRKSMVTINLNEIVKVKLTDRGKDIFYHQLDEVNELIKRRGGKPLEPHMPKVDADGYTDFQLWRLMQLYGPHIGMGLPLPFDLNNIVYTP